MTGWTAGLGDDYSLTDQWLLGAEYQYTDYGHRSFPLGSVTRRGVFPMAGSINPACLAKKDRGARWMVKSTKA